MAEIGIRELKAKASEIVQAVREERARYIVTHRGKPVAIILPLDEAPSDPSAKITAWDELIQLGEKIGRGWKADKNSAELLAEMRR